MIAAVKQQVREANLELVERGLVFDTFGNASGIDRDLGLVVIKPSGVPYGELSPDDMAVVSLESGEHLEGLKPSSDTPTHLEIYRSFATVGGVVHTHSPWASSWAQAHRSIPCFGTTHADYFRGAVPCSRDLTDQEIAGAYEEETGRVIVETFEALDPDEVPAVLVASHGVFTWGRDASLCGCSMPRSWSRWPRWHISASSSAPTFPRSPLNCWIAITCESTEVTPTMARRAADTALRSPSRRKARPWLS